MLNNLLYEHRLSVCVLAAILWLLTPILCFSQDRSRMSVYVPAPTGGTPEQQAYFLENFKMELAGARYQVAETVAESTFSIVLDIQDNPDFDSGKPADDKNRRYLLDIKLIQSRDNSEIVSISFPFTDLDSMADWNLYLVYQTMANAVPPDTAPEKPVYDDAWRNKWLYIGGGLGLDMGYLMDSEARKSRGGMALPAARLSAELQFVDFLALQLDPFRLGLLHDSQKIITDIGFGAALKGIFKPATFFMLEPYAGVEYNIPLDEAQDSRISALAGFQMGTHAGSSGVLTVDFSFSYGLGGKVLLADGKSGEMLRFTLLAGYKAGFFDR